MYILFTIADSVCDSEFGEINLCICFFCPTARGEDGFFRWAHLALQNHNMLPRDYMALPVFDRAFIAASDMIAAETLKNQQPEKAR